MKDVRSKLEGRILFHYLFVDSEYTRIVDEDERIDWGTSGNFATYGIAKLLPQFSDNFMHLKRDYSGIGSSFGIMITIFQQSSFLRDCYASPKWLGFEFPFLKHKKYTREFYKECYNRLGFENDIQKFSLSGFKRRGKSVYSFQVLLGFKENQENHKDILDSFKD